MDVGLLVIFQNYLGRGTDDDMVAAELALAELAEDSGFDKFWAAEHHFTDYSACPDNIQYLSYIAGRTSSIKLGTGAVIVPWNSPIRVAEKMAFLDYLSAGRAVLYCHGFPATGHESGFAVVNSLGGSGDRCGYHGQAHGHCFGDDVWQTVAVAVGGDNAGEYQDIGPVILLLDF